MSLTTRLSAFSLAALAVVLAGFSLALYGLAHVHLHRQDDERLTAALDTLVAAVEVHPDGVEWEPDERRISLGSEGDIVRWAVKTEDGRILDRSPLLTDVAVENLYNKTELNKWYVDKRIVMPQWKDMIRREARPEPDAGTKYALLVLTAGVSRQPTNDALRQLAIALTCVSTMIWLFAFLACHRFYRGALWPVRQMGAQADRMTAADRGRRLNVPPTGDELAALGTAFNRLLDRLEDAHERQRRFTGDASHQLRTPLAGLLGQVEVCLRHPRSPDEYRDVLTRVERQGRNLHQIVEMLLYLARADADALAERLEPVDLTHWLPAYLQRWSDHERAADLKFEHAAALCPATVQPVLLGQLLDNLLDNAFKYSQPGTPVRVRLTGGGSSVTISIEDQGDGIALDDLPHVFEPFYRSDDARRAGRAGVGLGLSIAQRIARSFGGSLTVQSRVGEGSRFDLTLKATSASNEPGAQATGSLRAVPESTG